MKKILIAIMIIGITFSCAISYARDKMEIREGMPENQRTSMDNKDGFYATVIEDGGEAAEAFIPGEEDNTRQFIIQPGDLIEVSVYGSDWMHHPGVRIRIPQDGKIFFPLLGEVPIAGLTAKEAAMKLDRMLMDGYLTDPKVSIYMLQHGEFKKQRTFSVSGLVLEPGTFPHEGNVTLADAVSLSGGLAPGADSSKIRVVRKEEDGTKKEYILDLEEHGLDFVIRGRDRVSVESAGTYTIYGQVITPGQYFISKELSVANAILRVGGFTRTAARNSVRVIRYDEEGKKKTLKVPVAHIYNTGDTRKDILLEDGDMVVVPQSWF